MVESINQKSVEQIPTCCKNASEMIWNVYGNWCLCADMKTRCSTATSSLGFYWNVDEHLIEYCPWCGQKLPDWRHDKRPK